MRRLKLTEQDEAYLRHPFPPQIFEHVNAERAFKGGKLSVRAKIGLMYGFVTGEPYERMLTMTHRQTPLGEPPLDKYIFATDEVSIVTVRDTYNSWRNTLFGTHRFLAKIMIDILEHSYFYKSEDPSIATTFGQFCRLSIYNDDDQETVEAKVEQWAKVKECFYNCHKSINVSDFRSNYSCISDTDMCHAVWRKMLTKESPREEFDNWFSERFKVISDCFEHHIKRDFARRNNCGYCQAKAIRFFNRQFMLDMFKYLSNFKIKTREQFGRYFISALIYALIKADIWKIVEGLRRQNNRWDMLADGDKDIWRSNIYELDHAYNRLVHVSIGSMIDCLADINLR